MTSQSNLFQEIFALWSKPAVLGRDMGVPQNRARQWIRRGFLESHYWPRLVRVLAWKFDRTITYEQLVGAAVVARGKTALKRATKSAMTRKRRREAAEIELQGEAASSLQPASIPITNPIADFTRA